MSHINGIGLENFKVFKEKQWFDFAPITILTGTNSSGKSTVINALRLLKSNYSSKTEEKVYSNRTNLGLDEILKKEFDTKDNLKRYGNLGQFINHKSKRKDLYFSFRHDCVELGDVIEVIINVRVQNNKLQNGILKTLTIRPSKTQKVIFSIEEKQEKGHVIKIDLAFFYEAIGNWIKYFASLERLNKKIYSYNLTKEENLEKEINGDINLHNKLFNDEQRLKFVDNEYLLYPNASQIEPDPRKDNDIFNVIDKLRNSESIRKEFEQGKFFDFSFLREISDDAYIEFLSLIKNYYKEISVDAYQQITKDILETLSFAEWGYKSYFFKEDNKGVDGYLRFDKSHEQMNDFGLSLNFFIYSIVHKGMTGSIGDKPPEINQLPDKEYIKVRIKEELDIKTDFVKKIFEPLISFFPEPNWYQHARMNHSDVEKFFYNEFIFAVLSLINKSFEDLEHIDFIEASRINIQRNFQLSKDEKFISQLKQMLKQPDEKYNEYLSFINKWVNHFEIAEKIEVLNDADTDNVKLYLNKQQKRILLADYGYGISQLLPIILSLIPHSNRERHEVDRINEPRYLKKVIIIEEPENSLHPALQSRLADMFAEAVKKFNIQLIIETHSEYLIRKLQYLTAKQEMQTDDTQIYYFYQPDKIPEGESQVYPINIQADGALSKNFGRGFFDEASNLNIALYSFTKVNKN